MTASKSLAQSALTQLQLRLQSTVKFLKAHPIKSLITFPAIIILATLPVTYKPPIKLPFLTAHFQQPPELPPPPLVPIRNPDSPIPTISAQGAIIIDTASSTILFEKKATTQLLPASTTKIMTALIALDTYPLDQVITIDQEEHTIGHTMNLTKGEQITVGNLLYGMLVSSGNDAALALAISYPNGGYSGFVAAMNQKAAALHLDNTTYKNVSGVETPGHLTTARDLANLATFALQNQLFAQIVSTPQITVHSIDGFYTHNLESTNLLLGTAPGVTGIKTGWTENALECLVISATRQDHPIITVVLGSQDRFGESQYLLDWVYQNHTWQSVDSLLTTAP